MKKNFLASSVAQASAGEVGHSLAEPDLYAPVHCAVLNFAILPKSYDTAQRAKEFVNAYQFAEFHLPQGDFVRALPCETDNFMFRDSGMSDTGFYQFVTEQLKEHYALGNIAMLNQHGDHVVTFFTDVQTAHELGECFPEHRLTYALSEDRQALMEQVTMALESYERTRRSDLVLPSNRLDA